MYDTAYYIFFTDADALTLMHDTYMILKKTLRFVKLDSNLTLTSLNTHEIGMRSIPVCFLSLSSAMSNKLYSCVRVTTHMGVEFKLYGKHGVSLIENNFRL